MDDAGQVAPRSPERVPAARTRIDRHRDDTGIRDRPARAAGVYGGGNVLWDCISLIDDATVEIIGALGGVRAIAISHPHYYTTLVEWSRAFRAPVFIHEGDRRWVARLEDAVTFWDGGVVIFFPASGLFIAGDISPGARSCIGNRAPTAVAFC